MDQSEYARESALLSRGDHRFVLPGGRFLPEPQSPRSALREPEGAFGLRGHNPCSLSAAAGQGEPALLPARRFEILRSPPSPTETAPEQEIQRVEILGDLRRVTSTFRITRALPPSTT
jgi:hypothetical protein